MQITAQKLPAHFAMMVYLQSLTAFADVDVSGEVSFNKSELPKQRNGIIALYLYLSNLLEI